MINLILKDYIKNKIFIILCIIFIFISVIVIGPNYSSLVVNKNPDMLYFMLLVQYYFYSWFLYSFIVRTNINELSNENEILFCKSLPVTLEDIVKSKFLANISILLLWTIIPVLISLFLFMVTGKAFNLNIYAVVFSIYLVLLSLDSYQLVSDSTIVKYFSFTLMIIMFMTIAFHYILDSMFKINIINYLSTANINFITSFMTLTVGIVACMISYSFIIRKMVRKPI